MIDLFLSVRRANIIHQVFWPCFAPHFFLCMTFSLSLSLTYTAASRTASQWTRAKIVRSASEFESISLFQDKFYNNVIDFPHSTSVIIRQNDVIFNNIWLFKARKIWTFVRRDLNFHVWKPWLYLSCRKKVDAFTKSRRGKESWVSWQTCQSRCETCQSRRAETSTHAEQTKTAITALKHNFSSTWTAGALVWTAGALVCIPGAALTLISSHIWFYKPVWTSLKQTVPDWTSMNQSVPLWNSVNQSY